MSDYTPASLPDQLRHQIAVVRRWRGKKSAAALRRLIDGLARLIAKYELPIR